MAKCATYLDGPVVCGALCVPLESLDVDDLCGEALEDDADVLDRQVRRLLHRHLQKAGYDYYLLDSAKGRAPGCVNVAGKEKTKITKPGAYLFCRALYNH